MRVRSRLIIAALGVAALASASSVCAQTGPGIVVSGRAGVPVMINGVIADGAVVYGDWGLARPGQGELIIEGLVTPAIPLDSRGYFPGSGRMPRVGRLEAPMPRRTTPAATYYREWSAGSDMRAPATQYPPYNPPEVIMAPPERRRR